jgi:hypothetical protein
MAVWAGSIIPSLADELEKRTSMSVNMAKRIARG